MDKIGFKVEGREMLANGMVKVSIGLLNSTRQQLTTNELPIILNSIKHTSLLLPETHVGFDYTLDFPLERGFGFPYVLDFALESETERNLT
jgi:hypothetical protein